MYRQSPFAMSWLAAIDARWPDVRRRVGPVALTIAIEIALLLALLSLSVGGGQDQQASEVVTTFDAAQEAPAEPEQPPAEPAAAAPAQAAPTTPSPPSALPIPPPNALPRTPTAPPVAPPAPPAAPADVPPSQTPAKIRAVIRSDMAGNRGPADTGSPGDTQRIAGSGPNGEPLYAAQWYREPTNDEFRGYFSRVLESGWALINCQTQPQFRVDNCVLVDQSDRSVGSAVMAMAWQFRVRPPRVGGRVMVGEWVRIRIDYGITRG